MAAAVASSLASFERDAALAACRSWVVHGDASVSLDRVALVGVYVVPREVEVRPAWAAACTSLLSRMAAFHESEFPGSAVAWTLHGPVRLPRPTDGYTDSTFYGAVSAHLRASLAASAADATVPPLPPPIAAGGATAASGYLPTHVVVAVFADWGREPATPENLGKYFLLPAAAAQGIDVGPARITRCGGSCSSYSGRVAVAAMRALPYWQSGGDAAAAAGSTTAPSASAEPTPMPTPMPESRGACRPAAGGAGATAAVAGSPAAGSVWWRGHSSVGFGVGVVTQEAWVVPEVHGCDAVSYHEGIGHAIGMPHPTVRQRMCVMDAGMYQRLPLDRLWICDELKAAMRADRVLREGDVLARIRDPCLPDEPAASAAPMATPAAAPIAGPTSHDVPDDAAVRERVRRRLHRALTRSEGGSDGGLAWVVHDDEASPVCVTMLVAPPSSLPAGDSGDHTFAIVPDISLLLTRAEDGEEVYGRELLTCLGIDADAAEDAADALLTEASGEGGSAAHVATAWREVQGDVLPPADASASDQCTVLHRQTFTWQLVPLCHSAAAMEAGAATTFTQVVEARAAPPAAVQAAATAAGVAAMQLLLDVNRGYAALLCNGSFLFAADGVGGRYRLLYRGRWLGC